jgi:hypothetical protein
MAEVYPFGLFVWPLIAGSKHSGFLLLGYLFISKGILNGLTHIQKKAGF